jgi:hypothetical protein
MAFLSLSVPVITFPLNPAFTLLGACSGLLQQVFVSYLGRGERKILGDLV